MSREEERSMQFRVELPHAVDPALAAELEKQAAHLSPHITRFQLNQGGTHAEIEADGKVAESDLRAKIERFLQATVVDHRSFDRVIHAQHQRKNRVFAS